MTRTLTVIGGGAAGLMAAVCAKEYRPEVTVCLLEEHDRVGKKLLATGNGRCNLTNVGDWQGRYHGDAVFAAGVLARFGLRDTLAFFDRLGVSPLELEEGRVYPRSLQASAVLDGLRLRAAELGVQVRCGNAVGRIRPIDGGFTLLGRGETLPHRTDAVVLCAGGKASASLSTDGAGYPLLTGLGHTLTPLFPAIVQLKCDTALIRPLKGIKTVARVTARAGRRTRVETGEVLFTDYGLSGPPVLQVSRLLTEAGGGALSLHLIPDWDTARLVREIEERCARLGGRTLDQLLIGLVHRRVGEVLFKAAGIGPLSRRASTLTAGERRTLIGCIEAFPLTCRGGNGWSAAQVTAGGVPPAEFDPDTLMSRRVKGLFAAGEILDVDGDCGGFNLQWAWSSGWLAGRSAAAWLD